MKKLTLKMSFLLFLLIGTSQAVLIHSLLITTSSASAQDTITSVVGAGDHFYQQATVYFESGNFQQALAIFQQALMAYREANNLQGAGNTLIRLGATQEILGNYEQALRWYEEALMLFQQNQDIRSQGSALSGMGLVYLRLGLYAQALNAYEQSLSVRRQTQDQGGEAISLSGIGVVYLRLGEYSLALDYHQQALRIRQTLPERPGEATSLHNIGMVYAAQESYSQATEYFQQALILYEQTSNLTGQERSLSSIAEVAISEGQYTQALELLQRALDISIQLQDGFGESMVLSKIGQAYEGLGRYEEALEHYYSALQIARRINSPLLESTALNRIAALLEVQGDIELAITFYKEFVNTIEAIRENISILSSDIQLSYTATVELTYRHLAELLLQENRILEAQQILDLLKVQELEDYLHNVRGNATTASGIEFWQPEREILERFNAQQQTAIALGRELAELRQVPDSERTPAQQARIDELVILQQAINRQFNDFLESAEIIALLNELNISTQRQAPNPEDLSGLRDDLQQLNAVLIYPLILDDRLELIVTTPQSPPLRRTVPVSRGTLNQAILDLREALEDPESNAVEPAYRLYQWLFEPLEADVVQTEIETILYAPDAQLRYIPLAVLHDGEQWLTERYAINNITARSLTDLEQRPTETPRILAGAFADETLSYPVQVGQQQINFRGLPFAGLEVEALVATLPNITSFIDQDFTLEAVQSRLNEYDIIHFATHAAFLPGLPEDSFILFGNGDRSTLNDVRDWALHNVDLVVLSACETGLGGFGSGEEILGLGYQFQRAGARATIASLWQVNDRGTQALMNAFYEALSNGIGKSEALRQAQIVLIRGDDTTPAVAAGDRGNDADVELIDTRTGLPLLQDANLSHPYYWAPFILIGNGL